MWTGCAHCCSPTCCWRLVALLIVAFVAFPYRGRGVPRAGRLSEKVVDLRERVDPGEAPPLGVLSDPARSRAMSARFERAEQQVASRRHRRPRLTRWAKPPGRALVCDVTPRHAGRTARVSVPQVANGHRR